MENLIGKTKYFVHKGTWKNGYEWRIQKVVITGLKIDRDNNQYAEFAFHSTGYEYPINCLQDTLEKAKTYATREINEEKHRQIEQIEKTLESDTTK